MDEAVAIFASSNRYRLEEMKALVKIKTKAEKPILSIQAAKKENVDAIGLSGLITPSLDEMVYLAKEMERQNFDVPLLIGGATTSKAHTAVKIDTQYKNAVVHVNDASRAVTVVGDLLNENTKNEYVAKLKKDCSDSIHD